MKKILLATCSLFTFVFSNAQNVGIGITTPVARLHVADSNVLFTAAFALPSSAGNPPISGAGTRMMWYADKAAFRSGTISGTQWDKDNIGKYSFATGYNSYASGEASFAAAGGYSTGDYSTALGVNAGATGYASTAIGFGADATGPYSTALGIGCTSSGINSIAIGTLASSSGYNSIAIGNYSNSSGNETIAMGDHASASGNNSTAMGGYTTASAFRATAMGSATTATGAVSTAMGVLTIASGNYSTALGYSAKAIGGTSVAMGYNTSAIGQYFAAMGNETKAKSNNSLVIGMYNDTTATNRLFEIGNGSADNARSNAMTVLQNGNTGIGTNPVTRLDIAGANNWDLTNTEGDFRIGNSAYRIKIGVALDGGGAGAGRIRASGGINVLYLGAGNTDVLTLISNGNATLAGTLTQSSDARLKKNILPLISPLENIQQLNGYTYNWIDENQDHDLQIGVLAQEVQKVYPQLVKQNDKGELSVNYIGLIPVLIEGMKEQQQQNEKLQEEVNELKQLVQQLLKNK